MTADAMTTFEAVRERILTPAGLDLPDLSRALGASATAGSRLADLFFESKRSRTFRLEDGRVVGGSFQIDQGVGARLARGAQVAFAHSAALNPPA